MLRPHGYGVWVGEAGTVERDTCSCGHCTAVIFVKPGTAATTYLVYGDDPRLPPREVPGAFCRVCMRPVCLRCHAAGRCVPFERMIEQQEARGRFRAQIGA
jgi:hypothetical protein